MCLNIKLTKTLNGGNLSLMIMTLQYRNCVLYGEEILNEILVYNFTLIGGERKRPVT
jgi:hypothetical protein